MVQLCLLNSAAAADDARTSERGHDHAIPHAPDAAAVACHQGHHALRHRPLHPAPSDCKTLPFTVVYSSGQDENFPATELNKGIMGRGWQSPRFCSYPQEIVVELESPSNVTSLQILCHEFKIASKVEIFVSLVSHSMHKEGMHQMKQLGSISLDANDKTKHQARELKHISINCHAKVVRLLLHSCFLNKMNKHNQVGIVALIITGEPCSSTYMEMLAAEIPGVKNPWVNIPTLGLMKDTDSNKVNDALRDLDPQTVQEIALLQEQKLKAVEKEEYDEAKRLKHLIERRIMMCGRIKELERQKQAAVLEEDYDCAKSCKLEIQRIRESCDEVEIIKSDRNTQTNFDFDNGEGYTCGLLPMENIVNASHKTWKDIWTQTQECASLEVIPHTSVEVDEPDCLEDMSNHEPDEIDATKQEPESDEVTLGGIEGSLEDLVPDPLSQNVLKELEPILVIIDQYHLSCIYSRHWQLRDKGLLVLDKHLNTHGVTESMSSIRTVVKVLSRALNDKVSNVYQTALQVLRSFVQRYHSDLPSKELHSCANGIIVVLLEKLGHSNVRIRESTSEALLFLAMNKEIGLNCVAPHLLKPPKSQAAWKPVLGRLQLLFVAIPMFGLQPQCPFGFSLECLMAFIVHSFGSPNGEVRNATVKAVVEVYRVIGPPLEKFLKGVKPAIREVLIEKFEKVSEEIQKLSPRKSSSREDEEKPSNELVKMTNRKVIKEQREQSCKENQPAIHVRAKKS